jgi:2,5-diketo-D-gluconate reductase B
VEFQMIKGEKVSSLGLGTWRLSGEECVRVVECALALGYRHIDTAQMYANEGEVGRGLRNSSVDREEIFLVTKVSTSSFSHDDVIRSTRGSLKNLQTEYVDLLLMHWPNPSVPLMETLGAMTELQEEGSVKHVGVSNFPPSMVEDATRYATVFCNQVEYHPYRAQNELLGQARDGLLAHCVQPSRKREGPKRFDAERDRGGPRQDIRAGCATLADPAREGRRHTQGGERQPS